MSKKEKSSFKGTFRKQAHPQTSAGGQGWEKTDTADTLNCSDYTEMRTPILIVEVIDE